MFVVKIYTATWIKKLAIGVRKCGKTYFTIVSVRDIYLPIAQL